MHRLSKPINQLEYTWRNVSFETRSEIGLKVMRIIFNRPNKYKLAVRYLMIARESNAVERIEAFKELIRVMLDSDKALHAS